MKNRLKISTILYITAFILFVMILGSLSSYKLMRFYIDDEISGSGFVPRNGSKLDTDIANNFFAQFSFVNINGFMARITGERELNSVVKMDNGYLNVVTAHADDDALLHDTGQIAALNDHLTKEGIFFIYIIPTTTSSKFDPKMPGYFTDHSNENLDRLGELLRDQGVYVIDMRDELEEDGIDSYEMMYKTDHHWTTDMGFYTYCKLADILERELGCTIDPNIRHIDNYRVETYKDWHLGSRGQRTGKFFAGIDDFNMYLPSFDTDLVTADGEKEGTYTDLLVNVRPLEKKNLKFMRDDINKRSIYDRVLESSQGDYINKLSQNDKHVLIIGDSFTKAIFPFMDISFERTRWDYGPTSKEVFEEVQPDTVIMLYEGSGGLPEGIIEYEWALSE